MAEHTEVKENLHKGALMMVEELEKVARSKEKFSWQEMMYMSDIMKDMSEVEKNLAKANYYDRKMN